jgi:DNA-binding HxlR family transcriptional regulator
MADLSELFHHRWAPPVLALLAERGGARFVEMQRRLGVGGDSLRRALDGLIKMGYVERNPGYGHPLRPEYVITEAGRPAAVTAARVLVAGESATLLRKWSVPVLSKLDTERRFSELSASLPGVTSRALAQALRDLETSHLVTREVRPTRPPSTVYRVTARGASVLVS